MKVSLSADQARALFGIISNPKSLMQGKPARVCRRLVVKFNLRDDNKPGGAGDLNADELEVLRQMDEQSQRSLAVEEVIGPFFDTIRAKETKT